MYYNDKNESVLKAVNSTETGLTAEEAAKRLEQNGRNEFEKEKKKTLFVKFLEQFKDVMILVLIVAAIVTAVIAIVSKQYSDIVDAGIILAIVILNAVIGVAQENKAESALEALKNMNKPYSKVRRDGEVVAVKSEEVVIGDVVILEAGDVVPADIRLTQTASLKIEEAALTGESVPVEKDADAVVAEDAALGDRVTMAYGGGTVVYGRGEGVVVATGMATEMGKIAGMLKNAGVAETPLKKQLAKTAKLLSVVVIAIAVVIFAATLIRHSAEIKSVVSGAFMSAVAIAVAAIPEGLPAIVTVVLALGVQRMSKRNAIIRRLPAVETLGCCRIICTDKTGTLTMNRMTVKKTFTFAGGTVDADDQKDAGLLVRTLALCNDSTESEGTYLGDPTETALAVLADAGEGYQKIRAEWVRTGEIPFDSVRKMMTTINTFDGKAVAYVKGATDMMLAECKYVYDGDVVRPITEEDVLTVQKANKEMTAKALRVLCAAINENTDDPEKAMTFVGLVGMMDPPREEVKAAVEECFRAGIRPVMITGDHIDTASAIGREIGLLRDGDLVMTGAQVDAMSDEEFESVVRNVSVFARVSPENKVRIVKAHQHFGNVVAMTGDGVNDAPSIKEADIGIGMGITGTEVSKGAADMILTDDNFATIVGAVEEGRKIYSNVTKAVQFLLSANIAEVLCLFIATVIMDVPFLTPVMILWVNMITDSLPALALGLEKAEGDVMDRPPRKAKASLFSGTTGRDIAIQGLMQTGLVMASYCLGAYVLGTAETGVTMAFITLCVAQLVHSFNMKSQRSSVLNKRFFDNKLLNLSFLVGVVMTIVPVLVPPIQPFFKTTTIGGAEWGVALGFGFGVMLLVEAQKAVGKLIEKVKSKKNTKRREGVTK